MHGLWPQFFTGKYPVDCTNDPPPADLAKDLDLIPELGLLQHEWSKHGTCAGVGGDQFFVLEHQAFHALKTPPALLRLTQPISLAPSQLLADFYQVNPAFPQGSLALPRSRSSRRERHQAPRRVRGHRGRGEGIVTARRHPDFVRGCSLRSPATYHTAQATKMGLWPICSAT